MKCFSGKIYAAIIAVKATITQTRAYADTDQIQWCYNGICSVIQKAGESWL